MLAKSRQNARKRLKSKFEPLILLLGAQDGKFDASAFVIEASNLNGANLSGKFKKQRS